MGFAIASTDPESLFNGNHSTLAEPAISPAPVAPDSFTTTKHARELGTYGI